MNTKIVANDHSSPLHVTHVTALLLAVLVICQQLFVPVRLNAGQLDSWHWRNATPFANTMNSVCFGGGKFVAVGDSGIIQTSSDGITWDDGRRPVTNTLNTVIFGNGQFLAVGNTGMILTSSDGYQWITRISGTTNDLMTAAFGNGLFVACGKGGRIVISTNAVNWQATSDGSADLNWITFGNAVFLISPAGLNVHTVRISADAQSWVSSQILNTDKIFKAEFGNGIFMAYGRNIAGFGYNEAFYSSADGTNWVSGTETIFVSSSTPPGVFAFENGNFYTVTPNVISRTPDGVITNMTPSPVGSLDSFRSMAYGAGRHVLIAGQGQVWTSSTGTNWQAGHSGFRTTVQQIIRGSNYVVVASGQPIMISADGINFVPTTSPTGIFSAVGYDGSNYVAVGVTGNVISGFAGEVYSSTNSTQWTRRTSNANKALVAVCRGTSRWIAVGAAGTITTSPNTLAWTLRSSGTANNLNGVAFGNGTYVAVGNVGTVVSSPDGATWDVQFSGTTEQLNTVQFLNGNFYAVGANGTIISSPDGSTWTVLSNGSALPLRSVAYGNGYYLACGSLYFNGLNQVFLMSTNGVTWQDIQLRLPMGVAPRSVTYLDGSFWITGDSGAMLRSDSADGIPRLEGQMLSEGYGFQVRITLNAPSSYLIQCSTNLLNGSWQNIASITNPVSPFTWIDTGATHSPVRLYRTATLQ